MEGKIREIIPPGFSSNTDDFISLLEKEANFKPFGSLLHTYKVHNVDEGGDLNYLIHKVLSETFWDVILNNFLHWLWLFIINLFFAS